MKKYEELIGLLLQTLQEGKALIIAKMPIIAQEILMSGLVTSIIACCLSLFLFISLLVSSKYCWAKYIKDEYSDWNNGTVLFGILSIIPFGIFIANIISIVNIKLAPTLYIITELKYLL